MPILFDSSMYITALREGGDTALLLQRWARESSLWLSSVVLEELYAGANPNDYRILERLEHDFEKAKRLLIPNLSDWTHAGKVLARLAQKYGYERIGQARLTNDALIATSAARVGITVLTTNQREFARLAEFCPLQWQARAIQRS
ncbi:MAG TPA: type II toxin-antitoxin system VapC family toxin [Silvibacterium sp.]|jgi:predicted nucleic acid-binding protein|nr:type II toxin-antitoxin system VapC family toxin [Silvibacterium sp.]